jgi:hypothetical protein
MSELDVIIIHIRAEQAAEYERLFAERELPRCASTRSGAPSSAPGYSVLPSAPTGVMTSLSTSSPSRFSVTPSTASTTRILGSRSSTGSPTRSSLRIRWCTADRCCTPSDRGSPGYAGNVTSGRSSSRLGQPRNRDTVVEHSAGYRMRRNRELLYVTAAPDRRICGYGGLLRDCGDYSRSSGSALAVVAGRQGSAQMVVRLMSLPSSMRWPGTS